MSIWLTAVIIFLLLDFTLILWIFWRRRVRAFRQEELNYMRSHWIRILDSFDSHPRESVMDADKLIDYALMRQGFDGSLGEKLKKAGYRFSDLNGLWRAHKLRNEIAHELSDKLNKGEAKNALIQFKKALNDLGAKL